MKKDALSYANYPLAKGPSLADIVIATLGRWQ